MELSGSNIKKLLYFLIFRETETSKRIPYISGSGNPKKLLVFSAQAENKKNSATLNTPPPPPPTTTTTTSPPPLPKKKKKFEYISGNEAF